MSVCNEDDKFKKGRLCKREKDLYVDRKITLSPMGHNRCHDMNGCQREVSFIKDVGYARNIISLF